MAQYELAIIGGGPAGISTALHLHAADPQLAGRIVVLEKETYPREKYCAGGVAGRALKRLAALGVRLDVPQVPFEAVALRLPGEDLVARTPGMGAVVRRIEFDHALARAAMERGIEVRQGCGVQSVDLRSDGVTLNLADGTVEARAVVGAEGVGGVVRRAMGLGGGTLRAQVIECDTEPVVGDPPRNTILFDASDRTLGGYAWDFPTLVDGQERVCRGVYVIRPLGQENVHERLRVYLERRGLRMEDYRLKPFGERGFEPNGPLSVPRALLVGEAAGIDIATGEGIAQAIHYGALAGPYLAHALRSGDLGFADWRRVVERSTLGVNLFFRLMMYRSFYPERERTERSLRRNRALMDLFALEFAGNPIGPLTVLSAMAHTPPADVPWAMGMARRLFAGDVRVGPVG